MLLENKLRILPQEIYAVAKASRGTADDADRQRLKQLFDKLRLPGSDQKILHDAIAKWGTTAQLRKLQEECGELVAAVNQADIGRDPDFSKLAAEVGDVEIMIEQARLILGNEKVDAAKQKKLRRLREVIDDPTR